MYVFGGCDVKMLVRVVACELVVGIVEVVLSSMSCVNDFAFAPVA